MGKYAFSQWFGNGSGHAIRVHNSNIILFKWNGRSDGFAIFNDLSKTYQRNDGVHKSLAALLRAVAAEHLKS